MRGAAAQVGFTAEGRVLALQLDLFSNAGNSLDLSTSIMDRALVHSDCACAPRAPARPPAWPRDWGKHTCAAAGQS